MAFSVNTNIPSLQANLYANTAEKNVQKSLIALSAGSMLTNAAFDSSSLAIADTMSSQVAGLGQAMMNINDGIGVAQTADGALGSYNDNLSRIRTLTLQASNGILSDSDKQIIQKEIDQLVTASNDIVNSTSFNDQKLLDGSGSFTFQTGANTGETQSLSIGDMSSTNILGNIDVTTSAGLSSALDSIDSAMGTLNETRADIGAFQNSLVSTFRNISVTQVNTAAAESQLRDTDFAAESANFSQQNLMSQFATFAQAQSNSSMYTAMRLLQ